MKVVVMIASVRRGFCSGRRCSMEVVVVVMVIAIIVTVRVFHLVGLWVRRASGGTTVEPAGSPFVVVVSKH